MAQRWYSESLLASRLAVTRSSLENFRKGALQAVDVKKIGRSLFISEAALKKLLRDLGSEGLDCSSCLEKNGEAPPGIVDLVVTRVYPNPRLIEAATDTGELVRVWVPINTNFRPRMALKARAPRRYRSRSFIDSMGGARGSQGDGNMSIRAIDWVFRQDVKPASCKLVLLALADNASDTGLAYPSTETIARKTSVSRTSVKTALDSLVEKSWVEDTGKCVGRTRQIKVYRLKWAAEQPKGAETDLLKGAETDLLDEGKGSENNGKGSKTDPLRGRNLTPEPSEEPLQEPKTVAHSDKPNGYRLSKKNGLVDSEWLARLASDRAYSGIDVSREFGKMTNWCQVHRKLPTRARFVNWLNRIDVVTPGIEGVEEKKDRGPEGWETVAHELYPRMEFPNSFWDITSPEVMERIQERLVG